MSFGSDLINEFYAETSKISGKINEVELFRALNRAFINLSKHGKARCEEIHGQKSVVAFDEIPGNPFFYVTDRNKIVRCELADLLIVTATNKELRVCCLQNKYEKKKTKMSIWDSFQVDMRQFYLLNKRPNYTKNGENQTLLANAICPSVASYGVFYQDGKNYNMNYHSAKVLKELTSGACGRRRGVIIKDGEPQRCIYSMPSGKDVDECQYERGIDKFGDSLENMLIGTPFNMYEGLEALADENILDAVSRVVDINNDELRVLRERISQRPSVVSYRNALVIRGEE